MGKHKHKHYTFYEKAAFWCGLDSYTAWNRRQKTDVVSEELFPIIITTKAQDYIIEETNLDIDCERAEQLRKA